MIIGSVETVNKGGLRAELKLALHRLSIPRIFLTNVQSLVNELDNIRLHITNARDSGTVISCHVLSEKCLKSGLPDNAIKLAGRHTLRADRTADNYNKTRGRGLCIFINKAWCTDSVIAKLA